MANPGYYFAGSCPAAPVWWIEWITDDEQPGYDEEIEWADIESDLQDDPDFKSFMQDWDPHPAEDHHVTYYRTRSPLGVPVIVIQHSGIENIWADGSLDLEAEEAEATRKGFWYLA